MIDWDKPIQLRNGAEVKVWTREARNKKWKVGPDHSTLYGVPVRGEYFNLFQGEWLEGFWSLDGASVFHSDEFDIINTPLKKKTVWVNLYRDDYSVSLSVLDTSRDYRIWGYVYPTEGVAKESAASNTALAVAVPIEIDDEVRTNTGYQDTKSRIVEESLEIP
jgi:hypothetical protein